MARQRTRAVDTNPALLSLVDRLGGQLFAAGHAGCNQETLRLWLDAGYVPRAAQAMRLIEAAAIPERERWAMLERIATPPSNGHDHGGNGKGRRVTRTRWNRQEGVTRVTESISEPTVEAVADLAA